MLTSGQIMAGGNKNMPFSLFLSGHRRRNIIDALKGKLPESVLNNYKKQLQEKEALRSIQ